MSISLSTSLFAGAKKTNKRNKQTKKKLYTHRRLRPANQPPDAVQIRLHQQDRPLPALAAAGVPADDALAAKPRPGPIAGLPRPARAAEHDHLQAARDWGRGAPAPGQHLSVHRSALGRRVLVRARGCGGGEWGAGAREGESDAVWGWEEVCEDGRGGGR